MPLGVNRIVRYLGAVALGAAVFAGAAYSTQMSAGKVVAPAPVAAPTQPSFIAVTGKSAAPDIDMAPFTPAPEAVVATPQVASLEVSSPTQAPAASDNPRYTVISGVNVRSGPSSSNDPLFTLAGGDIVQVADNQKGWMEIIDAEGRTGWTYGKYLKPLDAGAAQ